jgi:hypothetical protein
MADQLMTKTTEIGMVETISRTIILQQTVVSQTVATV